MPLAQGDAVSCSQAPSSEPQLPMAHVLQEAEMVPSGSPISQWFAQLAAQSRHMHAERRSTSGLALAQVRVEVPESLKTSAQVRHVSQADAEHWSLLLS